MFNFDMLHNFNHSGLASLIAPRAFMIEIGSRDGIEVEPRRFVDAEMARVTELYRELAFQKRGASPVLTALTRSTAPKRSRSSTRC